MVSENCSTLSPRKYEEVLPMSSSYTMAHPAATRMEASSKNRPNWEMGAVSSDSGIGQPL